MCVCVGDEARADYSSGHTSFEEEDAQIRVLAEVDQGETQSELGQDGFLKGGSAFTLAPSRGTA